MEKVSRDFYSFSFIVFFFCNKQKYLGLLLKKIEINFVIEGNCQENYGIHINYIIRKINENTEVDLRTLIVPILETILYNGLTVHAM